MKSHVPTQIVVRTFRNASYLLNLEESLVKDVAYLEIEYRLHELDVIMLRKVKILEEELDCANETIQNLKA